MITRFKDLFEFGIPDWVLDLFNAERDSDIRVDIEDVPHCKNDFGVKPPFERSYQH